MIVYDYVDTCLICVLDQDISRSYTPVPEEIFANAVPFNAARDHVCFLIKRYPDGKMSRYITGKFSSFIDKNMHIKIEIFR